MSFILGEQKRWVIDARLRKSFPNPPHEKIAIETTQSHTVENKRLEKKGVDTHSFAQQERSEPRAVGQDAEVHACNIRAPI